MRRRDLLVGGGALCASGTALALMPRRHVILGQSVPLDKVVPRTLPGWASASTDGLIVPRDENDLASKLYSQIVQRVYVRAATGEDVMMLIAYGDTQNDLLQLHRPEVCYAAFGFRIEQSRSAYVPLAPGAAIPCRHLTAEAPDRVEHITYWTRIGEYLPTDGRQQRWDKLRTQFAGIVPDGALVRISSAAQSATAAFATHGEFVRTMLHAVPRNALPVLIGTGLSRTIAAGRS